MHAVVFPYHTNNCIFLQNMYNSKSNAIELFYGVIIYTYRLVDERQQQQKYTGADVCACFCCPI